MVGGLNKYGGDVVKLNFFFKIFSEILPKFPKNTIVHLSNSFEVSVSVPSGKSLSLDGLLRIVRG